MMRIPGTCGTAFLVMAAAVSAPCLAGGVEAFTKPSEKATLSFVRPGVVAKVLVKEGDPVKQGQILVHQDDAVERIELEWLKFKAANPIHAKAADAQLAQKKVDLKRIESASEGGGTTPLEIDYARLDVLIAELTLELRRFEQEQDRRKYEQMKRQLERMRITSPIDGVVKELLMEPGEAVDALAHVIEVVKIDPLRIDVGVPLAQAVTLRPGGAAQVEFAGAGDPPGPVRAEGKVIHVSPVADAGSDTLTVCVEVPNPTRRPAGEKVTVKFPPPEAAGKNVSPATPPPVGPKTDPASEAKDKE